MNRRIKTKLCSYSIAVALLCVFGCGENKPAPPADTHAHLHVATPPHGGTPVVLGDGDYQIEFVRDVAEGRLVAYILDGEMENFVRIKPSSFEVAAKLPAGPKLLRFAAVANPATGETVGNTAQFEAQADWLKGTNSFDGVIQEINVEGTVFKAILFNFPKGTVAHEMLEK